MKSQWVCRACGYNMIGKMPDVCPFCGKHHTHFMTWQEVEEAHKVTGTQVNQYVTQLMSVPGVGLEHACYRVATKSGPIWIDSPSAFNQDLQPVEHIFFTHQDFLGASNQYRELWSSQVHLHQLEATSPLAQSFPVDDSFDGDFTFGEVEAFHVGGHAPGFTVYVYDKVMFVCDYAYPPGKKMRLNRFRVSDEAIHAGGRRIQEIAKERELETVCGYNYFVEFEAWMHDFDRVLSG